MFRYSIKVRSTDKGGLYRDDTFTVSVNNLNEAPVKVTVYLKFVNFLSVNDRGVLSVSFRSRVLTKMLPKAPSLGH